MGLDMRLYKKHYVKNQEYTAPDKRYDITILRRGKPTSIRPERISEITEEVATWRKANAIHNWFANELYAGDDDAMNGVDCWVSREQLQTLLNTVTEVLEASKLVKGKVKNGQRSTGNGWEDIVEDGEYIEDPTVAIDLLPTQSGFFFGSTEYDQWYYNDLVYTKDMLEGVLAELGDGDFYYEADW